jgi:hypothetical protein
VGGAVVVHRVVAAAGDGTWLLTRGDARVLPDRPAAAADVIGRVTAVRAGDGFADIPPRADTRAQRTALAALRAALRASPTGGTALIAALVAARRALLLAAASGRRLVG